jgi:hypothetical protein
MAFKKHFRTIVLLAVMAMLVPFAMRALPERQGSLRVLFTCDIDGRLEPCGCFAGQMGGVSRIDTLFTQLGAVGDIRLDAGNAVAGPADYQVLYHRKMLKAFEMLGFDALNLGAKEAGLNSSDIKELIDISQVPFVSANVLDKRTEKPIAAPYVILKTPTMRKVAVTGVVDPASLRGSLGQGLAVEDMFTALTRVVPEVKKKADVIILLAFASELKLSEISRRFYEIDMILGGDVSQPAQELIIENRSVISYVTNEARAVGVLGADITSGGHLKVRRQDVQLVHNHIPESERIRRLAEEYRAEIREVQLAVDSGAYMDADSVPGVMIRADFAGTEACAECHADEYKTWQASRHARAFDALVRRHADGDPGCIGCHVTGFGSPGGYERKYGTTRLVNVGCESCHGPGSLHISRMKKESDNDFEFRKLAAGDCEACHHGEFSRPFAWDEFWPIVTH